VSRGLGQIQRGILRLLLDRGGILRVGSILGGLFDKVPGPGTKEYNVIHGSLSRSLKALRQRDLIQSYTGIAVAGRAALVVALTTAGAEVAREIEWEEVEE